MPKTYIIKANRTPLDVVKSNDEVLGRGYTLEEASQVSVVHQRTGDFCAVWIEEEKAPKTPRVTRSTEQDFRGNRFTVVRTGDGWMI